MFRLWYITLSWIGLCFIIDCIFITLFAYKLRHIKNQYVLSNMIKYGSITCFIACTMNTGCDFAHNYWGYLESSQYQLYTKHYHILIGFADICYYTATISLYLIIVNRLYTTFKKTQYYLSKLTIIFISILLMLSALEGITYFTSEFIWNAKYEYEIIGSLATVYVIIDGTLNLTVSILFINKLRKSMIDVDENEDKFLPFLQQEQSQLDDKSNVSGDEQRKKVSLNAHQIKFLNLMTRYTLLSVIAIIFNQLFNLSSIFCTFYYTNTPSNIIEGSYMLRSMENLINVIVIYLNFGFNAKEYYCLCGCCHRNCLKIMKVNTKRKITRIYVSKNRSIQFSQTQQSEESEQDI